MRSDAPSAKGKPCGASHIPKTYKCRKGERANPLVGASNAIPSSPEGRTALLATTAGGLVTTAVLGTLARDVLTKGVKASMIPPKVAPKGLYDSFKPGDLLYNVNDFLGAKRAHYAVYVGRVNGVHTVFDVSIENTKRSLGSPLAMRSRAKMRPLEKSIDAKGTSYALASRVNKDPNSKPTADELLSIIKKLENKTFNWDGYEANCESFARTVVNDLPVSLQGQQVEESTRTIVKNLMNIVGGKDFSKADLNLASTKEAVRQTLATAKTDGDSTTYYRTHPEAAAKKVRHQATINARPEERKRRASLNRERRRRGIAGKGGPDISHTVGGKTVLEDPSTNRARNGHGKNPRLKGAS